MEGWVGVASEEQTVNPLLISLLPNLASSRSFGIVVTASPCLTQLVSYVKASNVSGSKQAQTLLSGKSQNWQKKKKQNKKKTLIFCGGRDSHSRLQSLQSNPHGRLRSVIRVKWCHTSYLVKRHQDPSLLRFIIGAQFLLHHFSTIRGQDS